jgi:hypothetical protein
MLLAISLFCRVVLLVIFTGIYLMCAQTVERTPRVDLTVSDLQTERFCFADGETYSQIVRFKGTYKNAGTSGVRLFLGTEVPAGMLIAKSLDELQGHKLETEQNLSVYPDAGGQVMLGSDRKNERSVDLKSGESADSPNVATLVVRSVPRDIPGTIAPGEHFVQIRMWVRTSSATGTAQTQKRSARPQWVQVQSQPVRVEVPSNPRVEQCDPK